ncbi:MAG: serine/threonine-protein kinase [Rhodothermaceae bacterium]|nr:serine/threonine-protein kinase [Rhodothermaceae bacterium]
MDAHLWNKLEELYFAVIEMDESQRTAFLDKACANNPTLRHELEGMLNADGDSMALALENRVLNGDSISEIDPQKAIGTRIGPYCLDQLIGEGGMGEVYLAHRADEQYKQKVALKRVRPGYRSSEMMARFRIERQVLAKLTHPNITQLLDGGIDDEGRPYLVMQYIEGTPITTFCDTHRLSIEDRIQLFRVVCSAVQHAHQNLVVHRDLKPSNILVTEKGDVKLLDFGIAKLLNPEVVDLSMPVTQSQMRLMTPEYAAPEQVKGETITTATDVYALGVLLYELLAGRRPYRINKKVHAEIERIICNENPSRPSTALMHVEEAEAKTEGTAVQISQARRTGPSRLRKALRGDLDNIVMMALRKEPERRYVSAEQFSEDLSRFLSGRPVAAQKDTLRYRIGKFTQRNRVGVGVSLLVLAMAMAFTLSTIQQSREIAAERDRAQIEAEKATQVSNFMIDLFDSADPNQSDGEPVTVEQILREGAKKIEQELAGQPEVQADLMVDLGRVHRRVGLLEESIVLFDRSKEIRSSLYGLNHELTAHSMMRKGDVLVEKGEFKEGEPELWQALAIQRELLEPFHSDLAITLNALAFINYHRRNLDSAEVYMAETVEVRRRNIEKEEGVLALLKDMSGLAAIQLSAGKDSLAQSNLEDAMAFADTLGIKKHIVLTNVLNNLGHLKIKQNKLDEAQVLVQQALEMRRDLFGNAHPSIPATLNNLAMIHQKKGSLEEAERFSKEGLELQRKIGGAVVGRSLLNYGIILADLNRFEEAESAFLESIQILQEAHGATNPFVKRTRSQLAELYAKWGKPELAEQYAE